MFRWLSSPAFELQGRDYIGTFEYNRTYYYVRLAFAVKFRYVMSPIQHASVTSCEAVQVTILKSSRDVQGELTLVKEAILGDLPEFQQIELAQLHAWTEKAKEWVESEMLSPMQMFSSILSSNSIDR